MDLDFFVRFASIALIDLALSGDNALVIGMAAASLPHRQRRLAILFGGLLAIVLRVGLTAVASRLATIPLISAFGGVILLWVVWGLLKADTDEEESGGESPEGLRNAIRLIVVADVTMSLDNVLAVGGTAHGNDALVIAGLLMSMPLLMAAGGLISSLIDRLAWIVYVGAAAISLTAARMFLEDEVVAARLPWGGGISLAISLVVAVAVPLAFSRWHARGAERHRLPEQPA